MRGQEKRRSVATVLPLADGKTNKTSEISRRHWETPGRARRGNISMAPLFSMRIL